jgi:phage-related protein
METMEERKPKPVVWMGSSKEDLKGFPDDVQGEFGHALWVAQEGDKYVSAKPLKGFGGASVLEIVEDYDGDTYRAVYTVRFAEAVFVLHCYQKKSRRGTETPKSDMELIKRRLKAAEELYEEMKRGGVL